MEKGKVKHVLIDKLYRKKLIITLFNSKFSTKEDKLDTIKLEKKLIHKTNFKKMSLPVRQKWKSINI
jgi:hypothetical protein